MVDDGSTDNTEEVISQVADLRVKYLKKENAERGAARNYGVAHSTGKYVTFLDSDDKLFPDHLEQASKMIENHNNPEIFHLGYQICNQQGKVLHTFDHVPGKDLNNYLLRGNYMSCMGVFLRKDIAENNKFSEERALSGTEDWLLWLQLGARYKIPYSTHVSATMVDHDTRSIKSYSEQELNARRRILVKSLRLDREFTNAFGKTAVSRIEAHMKTYAGLHLLLSNQKKTGWHHYLNGIIQNPAELYTRRTLAMIKHTLL